MNKNSVKYLPLLLIILSMAIIYFSGIYQYLSFDYVRMYHKTLKTFIGMYPLGTPIVFCLVYVLTTALSIPGAVFLTLLGGYLFPQPLSTILVVLSATCGATIVFLAARSAFQEFFKKKAGPFIQKMDHDFQDNAVSYMLFLRFVPLFPFWIVNIAPALFGVSAFTFIWTTFIGILPGSLVITLGGGGLDQILEHNESFSISTIFNTQIRIALVLLGVTALIPMIWKKLKKKNPKDDSGLY